MTISWSCALLHILGGTLGLVCLPGHLLHLGMTFLSGGWKTFLNSSSPAVFIILVPGDWGLLGLTLLLRNIITDLPLMLNVMTNLERMESQTHKIKFKFTVLVIGSHCCRVAREHFSIKTSLVLMLGTKKQCFLGFLLHSLTGTGTQYLESES